MKIVTFYEEEIMNSTFIVRVSLEVVNGLGVAIWVGKQQFILWKNSL